MTQGRGVRGQAGTRSGLGRPGAGSPETSNSEPALQGSQKVLARPFPLPNHAPSSSRSRKEAPWKFWIQDFKRK